MSGEQSWGGKYHEDGQQYSDWTMSKNGQDSARMRCGGSQRTVWSGESVSVMLSQTYWIVYGVQNSRRVVFPVWCALVRGCMHLRMCMVCMCVCVRACRWACGRACGLALTEFRYTHVFSKALWCRCTVIIISLYSTRTNLRNALLSGCFSRQ